MSSPLGPLLPDWNGATPPARAPIFGRYCQLQPLNSLHSAQLWPLIADFPALWDYLYDGPFATQSEFEAWLELQIARDDAQFFAICDAQNRALGLCSFLRIDPKNGSMEIGNLLFSPRLQRSREATEAMFLAMKTAFENGFRRYEWKCNALNAPSKNAALRLGFSFEGTFRSAAVVKGRSRDTSWFSLIDSEWPALEKAFEAWLSSENFDENGEQLQPLRAFQTEKKLYVASEKEKEELRRFVKERGIDVGLRRGPNEKNEVCWPQTK